MSRWVMIASLVLVVLTTGKVPTLRAQEMPEQFKVWGRQAAITGYLTDGDIRQAAAVTFAANEAEKANGFVLFSKPVSAVISQDYVPVDADRCQQLQAADCRGQYGCATFFVYALQQGEFRVSAGDLSSATSGKIPAVNLDLRVVHYIDTPGVKAVPVLLESPARKLVPAGRIQQFWLTYYIPKDAKSGDYKGALTLEAGGKKVPLPFTLKVYSFDLAKSAMNYSMFSVTSSLEKNPQQLYNMYADQHCHDMTSGNMNPPVTPAGDLIPAELTSMLDAYKKAGFDNYVEMYVCNRIICRWSKTPDKALHMWGPWSIYLPISGELDQRYLKIVSTINAEVKSRGLKLMLQVSDEAGAHPWTIEATQHYLALVKKNLPDVVLANTCGGGWAMKQPEEKLWKGLITFWTTNRWLPDKIDIVRKEDPQAQIQLYNMGGAGSGAGSSQPIRTMYGYFPWKAKAAGVTQWVYNELDTRGLSHAWADQAGAGFVPTLHWEAVREGAKDYLYVNTLQQALNSHPASPAAARAAELLKEMDAKIELKSEKYDPIQGGGAAAQPVGTYEQWRTEIADLIPQLQGI